jgi:hypothetical protein
MPGSTTIAETLSHVFAERERGIPPDDNRFSLFQAWTKLFGGPDRGNIDVVAYIGQVSTILIKLRSQINASIKLRDLQKKAALATLSDFDPLFNAARFHEAALNFRAHCDEIKRGNLGLIGHSLAAEFGEPRLEKPGADELIEALKELKELLADSSLALDLQVCLTEHVDVMIWWLSHPEMASLQNLFETVGSAMVIARQMRDRDPQRDSSEPTASKGVYDRVVEFVAKVGKLMGLGARGAEDFEKLTDAAQHILENLGPSG